MISSLVSRSSQKVGLSPGTTVFVGEQRVSDLSISVITYDDRDCTLKTDASIEDVLSLPARGVSWVDIVGLHDVEVIEQIGAHFGIHPLVLEDIVHTEQRVKIDEYETSLFIVLRQFETSYESGGLSGEQVSLVVTPHCLLSFQERPGDAFDTVRARLKNGSGRIRKLGTDYLAYSLIDATVDSYFSLLENLGEEIEELEEKLLYRASPDDVRRVHVLRRQILLLRRAVWPLREVVGALERHDSHLIKKTTRVFLRDVYDHTLQVIESIEGSRELLSSMLELYLSNTSNKMNEVMRTLTAITAVFIPLTFIAGIYGMNFRFMPELEWHYGYFAVLAVMLLIAAVLVLLFRRKGWI